MGWRFDVYYKFCLRTEDGNSHDAMALITKHIELDQTSEVKISPGLRLKPFEKDDPEHYQFYVQHGAVVVIEFKTEHKYDWKSKTLDSVEKFINAGKHDAFLLSMDGDNELACVYGIENFKTCLPEPPARAESVVAMLQARADAAQGGQEQ